MNRFLPTQSCSRRRLLQGLGLGALAGLAPRGWTLGMPGGTGRNLVLVHLYGGYDALSILHPASGAARTAYLNARPLLGFDAGMHPTLPVNGTPDMRWHPSCGFFKSLHDQGELLVVQKTGLTEEEQSHFKSRSIMARGRSNLFTTADQRGWLGRLADAWGNPSLDIVGVGHVDAEAFAATGTDPVRIRGWDTLRDRQFGRESDHNFRRALLRQLAAARNGSSDRLAAALGDALPRSLDASATIQSAIENLAPIGVWPDPVAEPLSGNLSGIARAIRSTLNTRVFLTTGADFDTHGGQEGTQLASNRPTLTERLDLTLGALEAFVQELRSPGVNAWDRTMVIVFTEFGRRIPENQTRGTDHGHGFHAFVLGGNVRGGFAGNPVSAADLTQPGAVLPVEIDLRTLFHKALSEWLQLPGSIVNQVFDDFTPPGSEPSFTLT